LISHSVNKNVTIVPTRRGDELWFYHVISDPSTDLSLEQKAGMSNAVAIVADDLAGKIQFIWSLSDPRFIEVRSVSLDVRDFTHTSAAAAADTEMLASAMLQRLFSSVYCVKLEIINSDSRGRLVKFSFPAGVNFELLDHTNNRLNFRVSDKRPTNYPNTFQVPMSQLAPIVSNTVLVINYVSHDNLNLQKR